MSTQVDLFTDVQPTSICPAIAKPFVSRSTFYQGDCLVEMDKIADKSVDMILCDLPYGTTACKWDSVIPFEPLWEHYERVIKDKGIIILTGTQPFTSLLINSNIKLFRYEWIWEKERGVNFLFANKQPMKVHENICVFYKSQPTYNPIKTEGDKPVNSRGSRGKGNVENYDALWTPVIRNESEKTNMKYPRTVVKFSSISRGLNVHPTQKPVELMEYLIKTYTHEGETVLDNCMGSGTTGVACKKTGRHFIGIEKDEKYFNIAVSRVSAYCG